MPTNLTFTKNGPKLLWGMDDKLADGVGATYDQLIDTSLHFADKASPEAAMNAVKFGTDTEVASFHLSALKHVCSTLGLRFGGKKKALMKALKEFVRYTLAGANAY